MKTFNEQINCTTFTATAEAELEPQIKTLFQTISDIPPERLRDGFVIEMGFSVFLLKSQDGGYRFETPDCTKNPFEDTTDDLTLALFTQLEQTNFLRQFNLEGEPTRFDDKIIIANGALEQDGIALCRDGARKKGDSGWCIKFLDGEKNSTKASDYTAYPAFRLYSLYPAFIKLLALPYEYIVVWDEGEMKAILNDEDEDIFNG